MSSDSLLEKLNILAEPFDAGGHASPAEALLTLIDETVLPRRVLVAFGAGSAVSADLVVRSRRLVRVDAVRGIELADDQKDVIGVTLSAGDEDGMLTRFAEIMSDCFDEGGTPRFIGSESSAGQNDIMNSGVPVSQLRDVLLPNDAKSLAQPA